MLRGVSWASAEHVAHQFAWRPSKWFRLRNRQSTCQSDQSITKNPVPALLSGSQQLGWGERAMDSFPKEGASATICTTLAGSHFPPQHSTIHQWLLQSYWAFTRHLHIPDKHNKKHFKATLPAVPTLFHLSNAYKTVEEGQMLLRGATAHLLPASAPLKMLLFLLRNEYSINLSHLLSQATILSLRAQTGPSTLTSITLKVEQETWRKCFLTKPDSQSERMSHLGMMLKKSIETNCLFEEGDKKKAKKGQCRGSVML